MWRVDGVDSVDSVDSVESVGSMESVESVDHEENGECKVGQVLRRVPLSSAQAETTMPIPAV